MWRVGGKVPINVYDCDTPVCQCQTEWYAARIVAAMNEYLETHYSEPKSVLDGVQVD